MKEQRAQLEALSTAYRPALVNFFVRRAGSLAEAEDMTQELFMRLVDADLDAIEMPERYIFRMARNLVNDRARFGSRQSSLKRDYGMHVGHVDPIDPQRVAEGQEMLVALSAALKELPERTRDMFILYRVENCPIKTIASQYGVTVSAVEKQVRRAIRYVLARMEEGDE